jgi:hypothetical protein
VSLEKTDETADVIIVTMADDQCVHLADVDLHQLDIVGVDFRGKSEIEQIPARFLTFARLDVQSEAPLARKGLALCRFRGPYARDRQAGLLEGSKKEVVRVVGDLSDCHLVDHRRLDTNRRRVCGPIERNAARQQ